MNAPSEQVAYPYRLSEWALEKSGGLGSGKVVL